MAAPSEQLGKDSASREHPQLYAEQVRLLYRNAPVGLIATLINSTVLAFILRSFVPHRILTTWLVSILLISIARFVQFIWFQRAPAESSDVGRWGTWFVIGIALSGIIWGSAAIFLFPVESITHQAFLAFVLGGMAIGAAGAFSVVIPAFMAYTLPALTPLIVRFLAAGDEIHLAMGGMSLLFVLLITGIALRINRVTLASLLLRFENSSLLVYLSSAKNDLEKLNRELSSEIVERRKAEEELKRHREHLEELVDNRTGELIAANTELQQEISERKKFQNLLSQGKKEWEETFDTINDAITIHDRDFNVIRANKAAEKILGLQFLKILGQKCYRLYHNSDCPPEDCASCMALKTGQPCAVEKFEPYLNKFIEIKAFPLFDEDNQVIKLVNVIHDITERKRAEEEIKRRTMELEEANRELEAFNYSVSHDLRAPLRHMTGFAELLEKRSKPQLDETSLHYVSVISQAAKKMGILIDDLLAFSRIGRTEIRMKSVSLTALVKEVVQEMQTDVKERDIAWKIGELSDVYGDPSMLKLALANLISNAVKFTRTRSRAEIEIGCREEKDEVVFFVKDNGVGFDMKYADQLFGVFERLHPREEFEGTGIGLANVRRIISRHGGRTWAEGSPGEGAIVYFAVPKIKEA